MQKNALLPLVMIAMLAACGKQETTPPPVAATPAPVVVAAAPAEASAGEHTYKVTCAMCHATGTAGAPLLGNKDEWGPRIAQGKDVLYGHAINGFTGAKGAMPAKGANAGLSDDDVKAAVDYMVAKAS
jgi:cytochrome c5